MASRSAIQDQEYYNELSAIGVSTRRPAANLLAASAPLAASVDPADISVYAAATSGTAAGQRERASRGLAQALWYSTIQPWHRVLYRFDMLHALWCYEADQALQIPHAPRSKSTSRRLFQRDNKAAVVGH